MKLLPYFGLRIVLRTVLLLAVTVLGTSCLMHWAPGYYSDAREMNLQGGAVVRQALEHEQQRDGGVLHGTFQWMLRAAKGDLGESRLFNVPVSGLIAERGAVTLHLLVTSLIAAWSFATMLATFLALVNRKGLEVFCLVPAGWLLVLPVSALAMVCFLGDVGGPVLVMAAMIGAREIQFLQRLLRSTLDRPHYLYLKASGMKSTRILRFYALPELLPQIWTLLLRSFLVAVGLLVPVEVVFDLPGLGQLAWSSAMNRDMPVLMAITILFAASFALFGAMVDFESQPERV